MQLNMTTDYAIRIVLYLSRSEGKLTSKELSENLCIPQHYILKVTKKLENGKLINAYNGKNGGFSIAKDKAQISLLDIIKLTEPTIKINRCLELDKYCNRCATEYCSVRKTYCFLQKNMEERLSSITIEEILNQ
ncbi:Rrf2 family transcriptional regulator [Allocoprobacillus halotolerans]|uniref:Rrf2 family transcriptional regulator n=1 Tax=Allocoprobacillus halotolerans TaxID=2944914 RepID=A0ABY5HZQ0_9FIRM|nr:Rrf2 family transcriptional regulator [Allocoprobacillus halotolerans]UTY38558.1 Rrf2 family transcriptional regulator [Allocoprobacillus halotolerans]